MHTLQTREAAGDRIGEAADWLRGIVGSSETGPHGDPGDRQDVWLKGELHLQEQLGDKGVSHRC